MTPDNAAAEIRDAAACFGSAHLEVTEMWTTFHSHLHDLCGESQLQGEFLELFNALERWESAVGDDKDAAIASARATALRLAHT